MVREIAIITIDPREEKEFISGYKNVAPLIRKQPGFYEDSLMKVMENNDEYILSILWESVESHIAFLETEDYRYVAGKWEPYQKKVSVRHGIIE